MLIHIANAGIPAKALLLLGLILEQGLELKPGMSALAVNKHGNFPDAIRPIMEAVKFGELDIQIEVVAEKGTTEFRLKGPLKEMKRAW